VAAYEELTVTLPDGYEAYARYWAPADCRGGVLYLHGIQSHCGWYEDSASSLREAGLAVLQPDRRGSGRNHADRGDADSAQQLIDDAFACAAVLRDRCGHDRVHLLGVSWGGKLAAAMHATSDRCTASLTLIAPGLFPIISVSNAEKLRIGWAMVSGNQSLFDIPLNDAELFTADPRWIDFFNADPLRLDQATARFYLASRRMDRVALSLGKARPVPIHVFLAGEERIIDNEATLQFVRRLPWPRRFTTTYPRSRHTLEFGPDREAYLRDAAQWLADPSAFDPAPVLRCS